MGLFDAVSDAWNGATHLASDAWNGVEDVASDTWNGVSSAADWVGDRLGDAWGFVADHWKTFVAVAVGTVAFVAVATFAPELLPALFVAAPELAPWLVLGGAGAASGAASRVADDLMDGRTPGWDVLQSAAITGAFTVVTAGTLQWIAPKIGEAIPALKPLASRFVVAGTSAGDGADSVSTVIKAPKVAVPETPPEPAPVANAAASVEDDVRYVPMSTTQAILRAPKTRGLVGLLSGDASNHANNKMDAKHEKDAKDPSPGTP